MAFIDSLADLFRGGFEGYEFGHKIDEDVKERKRREKADADDRFRYENESRYRDEQNRIREEGLRSAEERAARALEAQQLREDRRHALTLGRDDERYRQTAERDERQNAARLERERLNDERDARSRAAQDGLAQALRQEALERARRTETSDFVQGALKGYSAKHGREAPTPDDAIGYVTQDPVLMARARELRLTRSGNWLPEWADRQAQLAKAAPRPTGDAALLAALEPDAPAPTRATPAPAPTRTPATTTTSSDNGSLRAQAQAAIKQGANAAAVAARFKQLTGQDL